jgi:hypothetical protein
MNIQGEQQVTSEAAMPLAGMSIQGEQQATIKAAMP